MRVFVIAAPSVVFLAGCVTVDLPEIPPYHPGYARAESGALAPAPPILDLSTAPPTASPGLPVPSPSDSEPGTIRSDEAGETPMTGNIHAEHGMMQHGNHGGGMSGESKKEMQDTPQEGQSPAGDTSHSQHQDGSERVEPREPVPQPERAATSETDAYTCPMHPEITSERPGNCPKCGMVLHKKEAQK